MKKKRKKSDKEQNTLSVHGQEDAAYWDLIKHRKGNHISYMFDGLQGLSWAILFAKSFAFAKHIWLSRPAIANHLYEGGIDSLHSLLWLWLWLYIYIYRCKAAYYSLLPCLIYKQFFFFKGGPPPAIRKRVSVPWNWFYKFLELYWRKKHHSSKRYSLKLDDCGKAHSTHCSKVSNRC